MATDTTVGLFVADSKRKRNPLWQQVAICSLAEAERAIERGTGRLVARDMVTGAVLAASDERDIR